MEEPFHHWCRSRQIFGGAKDFFPNFPKLARKDFYATFANKFSPTKVIKIFFGGHTPKKVFTCYFANLGLHFLKSINFGRHFYPDF